MSQNALSRKVNGNGKVIPDTHPESDQHQNWTFSRGSPPAPTHQIWWWSMNPFLRYLADKNSARTQTDRHTDRQTDRQTPMTTRPCGLRRAGKNKKCYVCLKQMLDKPDVMMCLQVVVRRQQFSADEWAPRPSTTSTYTHTYLDIVSLSDTQ